MKVERQLLLAGHPRGAAEGVDVRAPWDGRVIARVALAGPAEATYAADAADRAFTETRRLPARRRAAILGALAEALRTSREPLARLLSDEAGKPRTLARAEVEGAAAVMDRCAEEAHRIAAELSPNAGRLALTRA
ncbi:MAG: aldehyde dehydrogenase family protein, partial [Myxococcota bacterium]